MPPQVKSWRGARARAPLLHLGLFMRSASTTVGRGRRDGWRISEVWRFSENEVQRPEFLEEACAPGRLGMQAQEIRRNSMSTSSFSRARRANRSLERCAHPTRRPRARRYIKVAPARGRTLTQQGKASPGLGIQAVIAFHPVGENGNLPI